MATTRESRRPQRSRRAPQWIPPGSRSPESRARHRATGAWIQPSGPAGSAERASEVAVARPRFDDGDTGRFVDRKTQSTGRLEDPRRARRQIDGVARSHSGLRQARRRGFEARDAVEEDRSLVVEVIGDEEGWRARPDAEHRDARAVTLDGEHDLGAERRAEPANVGGDIG